MSQDTTGSLGYFSECLAGVPVTSLPVLVRSVGLSRTSATIFDLDRSPSRDESHERPFTEKARSAFSAAAGPKHVVQV